MDAAHLSLVVWGGFQEPMATSGRVRFKKKKKTRSRQIKVTQSPTAAYWIYIHQPEHTARTASGRNDSLNVMQQLVVFKTRFFSFL